MKTIRRTIVLPDQFVFNSLSNERKFLQKKIQGEFNLKNEYH